MIRRGVTEDLAAVARIHVDAWKQVYRGIMPEEVLEKRNRLVLLVSTVGCTGIDSRFCDSHLTIFRRR